MKTSSEKQSERWFLYALLLIGIPLVVVLLWWGVGLLGLQPPVLIFLAVTHVIGALIAVLVGSRLLSTSSPVSDRERELRATNEQFLSLYERSPVPYVTVNGAGNIIMYNLAAVRLLETTTDALLGQGLTERFTHDDLNALSVILGKIEARYAVSDAEVQVTTMTGGVRWVLLSVFVYEAYDERLISMVDITHQKAVDQAKSEFVALATHQLRTPVAAIRWNLELLERTLRESRTAEQEKYLTKLERNVLRMVALINDFLSVSKLEMGTFATELAPLNLTEFFDAVAEEFVQTIAEKQIVLEREYLPRELTFTTDSRLLHIMVSNLLSNAVKYVPDGGKILFRYEVSGGILRIVVSDTGIGIPEDEQHRLFTKFFRARNAQGHRAEGTGLGLYIVKQSAEKLGGTIEMESREQVGTIFTIQLPYQS